MNYQINDYFYLTGIKPFYYKKPLRKLIFLKDFFVIIVNGLKQLARVLIKKDKL